MTALADTLKQHAFFASHSEKIVYLDKVLDLLTGYVVVERQTLQDLWKERPKYDYDTILQCENPYEKLRAFEGFCRRLERVLGADAPPALIGRSHPDVPHEEDTP